MTASPRTPRPMMFAALLALLAAGAWLRLDQYAWQIVLDDEWHAVHQLLRASSPRDLLVDLGWADYSIPLGLLYWLEAHWLGLSEFGMRWPMLLAGLGTLGLFSAYAWSRYPPRVAVFFAGLLACSPLLVAFAHMARPYAVTLLLAPCALFAFYRYFQGAAGARAWAAAYVLGAGLAAWLHILTVPLLLAPWLLEPARSMSRGVPVPWRRLAGAALPATLLLGLVLLPPVLANPDALVRKAGVSTITPATAWGAAFHWYGTSSWLCVLALMGLSASGLRRALARPVPQAVLSGLVLTLLLVAVAQPRYGNNPLTFARYLLPALPVLLLGAACGADRLLERAGRLRGPMAAGLLALSVLYAAASPLKDLVRRPNSSMNQLSLLFDFRPGHNEHARFLEQHLPLSGFWVELGRQPRESHLIAVAPFYFESFYWDSARWERVGRQRIVPAWLEGFCADGRDGELPRDGRFRFRNAVYLEDLVPPAGAAPDWLVFNRPIAGFEDSPRGRREIATLGRCLDRLVESLGAPDYEDEVLVAFRLAGRGSG